MRFLTKILLFSCLLSLACKEKLPEERAADEKLFICKCEQKLRKLDPEKVSHKLRYVFLVYSSDVPDCCLSDIAADHKGFKEIWENDAPDDPKKWRRTSNNVYVMDAAEAQREACSMKDKILGVSGVSDYPQAGMPYYPELMED